ncbi:MAG: S8 family serine peptidase [Alphaproteobacteria bacterium]|nr:S8 family serine peptidase [Alphaproteobacteria bacterium]
MIRESKFYSCVATFRKEIIPCAFALGLVASAPQVSSAAAYQYAYSPQNGLLGLNDTIWKSANYGAGVTYGVIDTGVAAPWVGFQSRVNTTDAACTINGCSKTMATTDDNGHGSFVASEIAGDLRTYGMVGIAPAATILPVKVLDAKGSGYVYDVAEGITYAVDHGANVLNLSLTFVPTANIITAINYAASKNAIIVFAGGNSKQALLSNAKIYGFTDAAIQRLIFTGSTNLKKSVSTFSNTPGTGGLISTTNKFYSFSSLWMMADGEKIWGASNYHPNGAYNYMTQMSGTSMSAPQVAGAAGLLAARWPFLLANGNIQKILLSSAQDLGKKGVDTTYGSGFLRIDNAFNPVGALTVPVNGQNVSANNATLIPNGALGNASGISGALSKAVAYDDYSRDFSIHGSSSILDPATTSLASARVQGQTGANARTFTDNGDGTWFAASFSATEQNPNAVSVLSDRYAPSTGLIVDPAQPPQSEWSLALQQKEGAYLGLGHGANAALSFNDARWGGKTAFFNNEDSMAGNLLGLASDANFMAFGMDLNSRSRLAVGGMDSESTGFTSLTGEHPTAQGMAASYTMRTTEGWTFSLSSAFLKEDGMLLGSVGGGYLSLGETTTMSFGVGASVDLGDGYSFGMDTVAASTSGSKNSNSLVTGTSRIMSAGFSTVLNKENLTGVSDNLGLSFKKPLRVYAGSANINVPTGTDDDGNAVMSSSRVNLAPSGSETSFGLNYQRPLESGATVGFRLSYRDDADNISGNRDAAAMLSFSTSF